jgi:thymidylate synthase (FAD)
MAHAVIEINTTRDIARQILRHRSFSFQEFSQRYAEVVADPVLREARLQDTANRQNSFDFGEENFALADWWERQQTMVATAALNTYNEALLQGIAKEVARAVLPEGLTPSRLYMSGSVRSWIHYIQLRRGNGTQKEHREIATMCEMALLHVMPSLEEIFDAP